MLQISSDQHCIASPPSSCFNEMYRWRAQCASSYCNIPVLSQVATGQPHEGSTYSARKDCQMALNRAEYARVKLGELGRTCELVLEPQQQTWNNESEQGFKLSLVHVTTWIFLWACSNLLEKSLLPERMSVLLSRYFFFFSYGKEYGNSLITYISFM